MVYSLYLAFYVGIEEYIFVVCGFDVDVWRIVARDEEFAVIIAFEFEVSFFYRSNT